MLPIYFKTILQVICLGSTCSGRILGRKADLACGAWGIWGGLCESRTGAGAIWCGGRTGTQFPSLTETGEMGFWVGCGVLKSVG